MTTEIPVTKARDELAELINRVAYGHERIILTRHSKAVACLVPPEDLQRLESERLESERLESEPLESEGQAVIRLTSAGQPPGISQPAPLPIAAQHRPPGQPRA